MKRAPRCTYWPAVALAVALGCDADADGAPPPVGGQSGDDGSEVEIPVGPQTPPPECEEEESVLDDQATSLLGATTGALLEGLRVGGSAPLFWVPFDGVPGTSFVPGPGQSEITLGLERDADEAVVQHTWLPANADASCPAPVLRVPVQLTLRSADGALDARVAAALTFTSARTAELSAQIAAEQLGGTFAVPQIGPPGQAWELRGLGVYVTLWPGGSSGGIGPLLVRTDQVSPPWDAWGGPGAGPPRSSVPFLPEHYNAVAVWPRREICNDGTGSIPVDANDPVNGWSPVEVASELRARSPWSVRLGEDSVAIAVEIETPMGLVCATRGPRLDVDVRATLGAEDAPAGSALERFAATTTLRISALAALDGSGLAELGWSRRDVYAGIARADFAEQTGLALEELAEYRDIWWSWHGRSTRAGETWSARGALLVSGLDAVEAARIDRQVAAGGPGPSIGSDERGFPILPGTTLIDAELVGEQ
jgi:hypothetical protein